MTGSGGRLTMGLHARYEAGYALATRTDGTVIAAPLEGGDGELILVMNWFQELVARVEGTSR